MADDLVAGEGAAVDLDAVDRGGDGEAHGCFRLLDGDTELSTHPRKGDPVTRYRLDSL
ncbi:hypothetical protein [Streptomyces sp. NPDC058335]|uniref:hypothetical protein n=1 Tax=Streptomyces sp. NPDC058335 TaxID=3346451 RepID=UPI0036514FD1